MKHIELGHPFDLEVCAEELDLFAEEVHDSQHHAMPPNSLSTLGCECGLSTFFCYGCGADLVADPGTLDVQAMTSASAGGIENLETALQWARQRMDTPDDKVGEALNVAFRRNS